jgi:hypothetical protein
MEPQEDSIPDFSDNARNATRKKDSIERVLEIKE